MKMTKKPVKVRSYRTGGKKTFTKIVKGRNGRRKVTFVATGKSGFGKYRITKNVRA